MPDIPKLPGLDEAARMAQQAGQQQIMMQLLFMPQPLQSAFEIEHIPNTDIIRVIGHSLGGVNFYWLNEKGAEQMASQLRTVARAARSGLTVIQDGKLRPPTQ